jgi:hypothetical protein
MADWVGFGCSLTWNDRLDLVHDFYAATAAVNVWLRVSAGNRLFSLVAAFGVACCHN